MHGDEFFDEDAELLVGIGDLYGDHKMYDILEVIINYSYAKDLNSSVFFYSKIIVLLPEPLTKYEPGFRRLFNCSKKSLRIR